MVQIQQSVKRPRGRPQVRCDEDTRQLIIEAAAKEFQAKGYAATCIGEVAQRAGVSTRTLYRLIPTKAALFRAVVADSIEGFMLAIDEQVLGTLGLEAGSGTDPRGIRQAYAQRGDDRYQSAGNRRMRAVSRDRRRLLRGRNSAGQRRDGELAQAPMRARPHQA